MRRKANEVGNVDNERRDVAKDLWRSIAEKRFQTSKANSGPGITNGQIQLHPSAINNQKPSDARMMPEVRSEALEVEEGRGD